MGIDMTVWPLAFHSATAELQCRASRASQIEIAALACSLVFAFCVAICIRVRLAREKASILDRIHSSGPGDQEVVDEQAIAQHLLMRAPFRPRLSCAQLTQHNSSRFEPLQQLEGTPCQPPTEALLEWFVPARSIWPSYYINAARQAVKLANRILAQETKRTQKTPIANNLPLADKLPLANRLPLAQPLTGQGKAKRANYSKLKPPVQELLDTIPSDEESGMDTPTISDEDSGIFTPPPQGSNRYFSRPSERMRSASNPCACTDESRFCFPIYISLARVLRDWNDGKIQVTDPTNTIFEALEGIEASFCRKPISPANVEKIVPASHGRNEGKTSRQSRWYIHILVGQDD